MDVGGGGVRMTLIPMNGYVCVCTEWPQSRHKRGSSPNPDTEVGGRGAWIESDPDGGWGEAVAPIRMLGRGWSGPDLDA